MERAESNQIWYKNEFSHLCFHGIYQILTVAFIINPFRFVIYYYAVPQSWATAGGQSMLLTAFNSKFDQKVTGSLVTTFGSDPPSAQWGLNCQLSDSDVTP